MLSEGLVRPRRQRRRFPGGPTPGFVVMRQDLMAARPDVQKAWIEAELDAQLFPRRSQELQRDRRHGREGRPRLQQRRSCGRRSYGEYPKDVGGSPERLTPRTSSSRPSSRKIIKDDTAFLFEAEAGFPARRCARNAVADKVAREALEARKLASPGRPRQGAARRRAQGIDRHRRACPRPARGGGKPFPFFPIRSVTLLASRRLCGGS